jgi:2-hydroxychromene-2-carboxylate isomerase
VARRLGVARASNPHFPVMTPAIMRGAVAARHEGEFEAYAKAMFRAMWVDGHDMGEAEELAGAGDTPPAWAAAVSVRASRVGRAG